MSSSHDIHIIISQDGEAWSALTRRVYDTQGEVVLFLAGRENELIEQPDTRKKFLEECNKHQHRLHIATKHPAIAAEARAVGLRVLDRTKHVRGLLHGHPKLNEALRVFSPQLWRQQLKSRLQHIGLLSIPKMRIFSLVGLSGLVFFLVVFRLLPSADIRVRPRQESVSQTVNIFLVQSGATAALSERVRRMPLIPITIKKKQAMTFEHISKEFIGSSSMLDLTIINTSKEEYALRPDTRFTNQAGMIFRIQSHAIVEPGTEVTVRAKAEDFDLYGQIIGAQGNVPAGLRWEIPGLAPEERALVYAENRTPARGGTTAFKTVLQQEDVDIAKKRLEQELLAGAKKDVQDYVTRFNEQHAKKFLQAIDAPQYKDLIRTSFDSIVLPTNLIGSAVETITVEGSITYTVLAYDTKQVLTELLQELRSHVREGRRLVDSTIGHESLVTHVIDWDDHLSWVKITVDLAGTEEYMLDPLSPTGALFGKVVRERIVGLPREDALRVLRNMPEVERVDIEQWPPWNRSLPSISAHISIIPY